MTPIRGWTFCRATLGRGNTHSPKHRLHFPNSPCVENEEGSALITGRGSASEGELARFPAEHGIWDSQRYLRARRSSLSLETMELMPGDESEGNAESSSHWGRTRRGCRPAFLSLEAPVPAAFTTFRLHVLQGFTRSVWRLSVAVKMRTGLVCVSRSFEGSLVISGSTGQFSVEGQKVSFESMAA